MTSTETALSNRALFSAGLGHGVVAELSLPFLQGRQGRDVAQDASAAQRQQKQGSKARDKQRKFKQREAVICAAGTGA